MPFYAGWGLTHDRERCSRRQRQLSLDELVHGALIDYPRYVSRDSGWFITPEQAIDELVAWRAASQRRTLVQALPPLGPAAAPLSVPGFCPFMGGIRFGRGRAPASYKCGSTVRCCC